MMKLRRASSSLAAAALILALAAPFAGADDKQDRPTRSDRSTDHAGAPAERGADRSRGRVERVPERQRPTARVETRHFARVGERVRRLPEGRTRVIVGGIDFFYFGGSFYRWLGPDYIIVRAPIGARVRTLPPGYVAFVLGARQYFFVNATYYLWEPAYREYVVVQEPQGAEAAVSAAEQNAPSESGELFAYPNQGQSEDQARRDRYECHLWAVDQSGYDPTYPDKETAKRDDYRRAMTACLVGRGYTVR